MLTSSLLSGGNHRHGFFTREGGVSEGIYAGLNCGPGSNDVPENVAENRARVSRALGLSGVPLVSAYQIHSSDVIRVAGPWDQTQAPQGDALVTDRPGVVLGILTADCGPVLFADPGAGVIGAAHAGWKGAVGGVLENTVLEMEALGAKCASIAAVLGPCIHQASYEVGGELRDAVLADSPWAENLFIASPRADHFQFDLPDYIRGRLNALGLGHVGQVDADTYANEDLFFSYRRTTHAGEPDYGRQVSAIALAEE